ncbi:MAG: sugar transferase [Rikenellaceae bacterium]|nr:sugar transferase [Rikenellaceae bacterium]
MYEDILKYIFDFILSMIALLIISPLLFLVWALLLIVNKNAGAVFLQTRPGKNGKLFKVVKFKTMNEKRDNYGNLLPDNERITPIGKVIRSLSLDEIPQLINVLKGDMSLVGPRPLLVEYLPLYSKEQARRHEVKPGITGWAQVNGRNAITWEQKFEYDVWYVDHLSFWLDMKILFLTIRRVFFRDGINASKNLTMEPFKGSK